MRWAGVCAHDFERCERSCPGFFRGMLLYSVGSRSKTRIYRLRLIECLPFIQLPSCETECSDLIIDFRSFCDTNYIKTIRLQHEERFHRYFGAVKWNGIFTPSLKACFMGNGVS